MKYAGITAGGGASNQVHFVLETSQTTVAVYKTAWLPNFYVN